MKRILLLIASMMLLTPSPVSAWGPRTHLEIAARLDEGDEFKLGSILPDMALAMSYAGFETEDAPKKQRALHSQEFVEALPEGDFARGWGCHIVSDAIEEAYAEEVGSADFAVDSFYDTDCDVRITERHKSIIQEALNESYPGLWEITDKEWRHIELAYRGYLAWYDVLFPDMDTSKFHDHEYYVWRSVFESCLHVKGAMVKDAVII